MEMLPLDPLKIDRKLRLVSELYRFAYEVKRTRIAHLHPDWPPERVHEKVVELIDRGCR